MKRNPIARALPMHKHKVIPDKRERTLRQLWDETAEEEIPERFKRLLDDLR